MIDIYVYTLASYMHIYVYIRRFIYIINIYIKGVYQTSSELKAKARELVAKDANGQSAHLAGPGQCGSSGRISRAILGFSGNGKVR